MTRTRLVSFAFAMLVALIASNSMAQVIYAPPVVELPPTPMTTYYAPGPAAYVPAPVYGAPVPVVTRYAPVTSYYAPAPVPVTSYYAPAPVPVTAYYGGVAPVAPVYVGRPAVVRTKVYYPYQPVRNFFKAVTW